MVTTHNLGFPRMGAQRELKFALEDYFRGAISEEQLEDRAASLRKERAILQAGLGYVPVGDFSLYDHVLDTSFLLGNVPKRVTGRSLKDYFRIARGRAPGDAEGQGVRAGEMTKWMDTNYHYIVPEFQKDTTFELHPERLLREISEVRVLGLQPKAVILGPVSYLWLGKETEEFDRLTLLPELLKVYAELLSTLKEAGIEWVQVDEPALSTELSPAWKSAYKQAYDVLSYGGPRLLLTTYFASLAENARLLCTLPVHGVHIDARNKRDVEEVLAQLPRTSILSLGVVDGRNVWKTDLEATLDYLEPIYRAWGDSLWLAPTCSLLHVPFDVSLEKNLDNEVKSWLSFAKQKLTELHLLGRALQSGRAAVSRELDAQRNILISRRNSPKVTRQEVRAALSQANPATLKRKSGYEARSKKQASVLGLPPFPTTTIGSFPQTAEIRRARQALRAGKLDEKTYVERMYDEITRVVQAQEELGLDVFVHGEAERNDMVEYFGELLDGFAISDHGWVQSYGSRCVKPPILFGDVSRPTPMTVKWFSYAKSRTKKLMKGMLTGPVTILNWSFVRDDQPRSITCTSLALCIREEVLDLEAAGAQIIQIDEAALREGLPLRKSEWAEYLRWAVESFWIASGGVQDETQIHTHMCYSEFNDIISDVAALDADVITIETSRSNMELLNAFESFAYPNEIGPGVYDIHSPNVPTEDEIVSLMKKAAERIPKERLWVNPDCGLKTRGYAEVLPALRNMVSAAKRLRQEVPAP